jgi:hypothetical protein
MIEIIQPRVYLPTETLSSWYLNGEMLCKTMELPLVIDPKTGLSARNISCILEGMYRVKKEAFTVKHPYPHFRIPDVPGRSGILVHRITYVKHLRGCIGVGTSFADHNRDGVPDIAGSSIALQKLYDTLPDEFLLNITHKQ